MVNKIIGQQKRLFEKEVLEEMEIHKMNPRLFFGKCNSFKDSTKTRSSIIKDDKNNYPSDLEKTVNNLKNYVKKLLNNTNYKNSLYLPYELTRRDVVEPEVKEPSLNEFKKIVDTLKYNKTPS